MNAQFDFAGLARRYAEAWTSHDPSAVAAFYAEDGQIQINRGDIHKGQAAIVAVAATFYAEFPDLVVHCDMPRIAGDHAIFAWTLEGHHAETGNYVKCSGWEEWELTADGLVAASLGWFDSEDYARQIAGK